MQNPIEGEDYYLENGLLVFTRTFHLKRGECCGSQCRHCPYEPGWHKGTKSVATGEAPPTDLPAQDNQ